MLGGEGGCNRKRDYTEDLKMCLSMDREECRGEGQGGCGRAAFRASPSSGLLGVLIMAKLDHHITVQCPAAKACLRDLRLQFSLWLGGRTVTAAKKRVGARSMPVCQSDQPFTAAKSSSATPSSDTRASSTTRWPSCRCTPVDFFLPLRSLYHAQRPSLITRIINTRTTTRPPTIRSSRHADSVRQFSRTPNSLPLDYHVTI